MKIGWNGITDCLSAVHLVTQLLLDCIELVANCWLLSNFYARLEIKKSEKLPIFSPWLCHIFVVLVQKWKIISSEMEKYPTSSRILRWFIKRLYLWRLFKFSSHVRVFYSSIKRWRLCEFLSSVCVLYSSKKKINSLMTLQISVPCMCLTFIYKTISSLDTLQIFIPCLCFVFFYKTISSLETLHVFEMI